MGFVQAAHAPHIGGLSAAFATLCLAGDVGLRVELQSIPVPNDLHPFELLFAETPSRFVVTTAPEHAAALQRLCDDRGLAAARVGETTPDRDLVLADPSGNASSCIPLATLRSRYTEALGEH